MFNKKLLLPLFILMLIAQWIIPSQMIWNREVVLKQGEIFKFKTAPVDPSDPLRGKYIRLDFDARHFEVDASQVWQRDQTAYVHLDSDEDGFAKIVAVTDTPPSDMPYVQARVQYVSKKQNGFQKLTISYPFDRYYMEESKAYDAELAYREAQRDSTTIAYALVSIENGNAVLKDVFIDDIPIKDVVEMRQILEK